MAQPVPSTVVNRVVPGLVVARCAEALEFWKKAFGAEVKYVFAAPDGKSVWHVSFAIAGTELYANDPMPGMSPTPPSPQAPAPVGFWIWTEDCDAAYKRALDAGATTRMPPADMFWGDRTGQVVDPFGYVWTFATHVKDMTPEEMKRAGEDFARSWKPGGAR